MKSLARIRKRQGRCYELAVTVMLGEAEADQWVMVHGRLKLAKAFGRPGLEGWYDHAWIVLDDGRIYDVVHDHYSSSEQYRARWGAVADHHYSQSDTSRLIDVSRNYGPWTDAERAKAAELDW
jgi:hypothetical protein